MVSLVLLDPEMKAQHSFEVSVTTQQLTWHNIAEALNLQVKGSPNFHIYFHF